MLLHVSASPASSDLKMKFKNHIFKALYKLASFAYVEVVELIIDVGGRK
jgi:hypothetical protein